MSSNLLPFSTNLSFLKIKNHMVIDLRNMEAWDISHTVSQKFMQWKIRVSRSIIRMRKNQFPMQPSQDTCATHLPKDTAEYLSINVASV
jgi:hypothetical protein